MRSTNTNVTFSAWRRISGCLFHCHISATCVAKLEKLGHIGGARITRSV